MNKVKRELPADSPWWIFAYAGAGVGVLTGGLWLLRRLDDAPLEMSDFVTAWIIGGIPLGLGLLIVKLAEWSRSRRRPRTRSSQSEHGLIGGEGDEHHVA